MESKSGFEGIYRSIDSPKRRQEVLDRLLAGREIEEEPPVGGSSEKLAVLA